MSFIFLPGASQKGTKDLWDNTHVVECGWETLLPYSQVGAILAFPAVPLRNK